jgi:hypothetical protein
MKPTHAELQQQIIDLAHLLGWRHLHVRRSIGKGRKWVTTTNVIGWPDLLLWSSRQPGRHIAIEVKVPPDKLAEAQRSVLDDLAASGFEVHVITPDTFDTLVAVFGVRVAEQAITASWVNDRQSNTPTG